MVHLGDHAHAGAVGGHVDWRCAVPSPVTKAVNMPMNMSEYQQRLARVADRAIDGDLHQEHRDAKQSAGQHGAGGAVTHDFRWIGLKQRLRSPVASALCLHSVFLLGLVH